MPIERLMFFAVWLTLGLLAGALIVAAWQRLYRRRGTINRS